MDNEIKLSFVLTTYNKLNYLRATLPLLISACKKDEEIIIADGGSTDGTTEYLSELLKEKKIHGFLSEKDNGEAHGTNKAILLSKGELVKIITDDDVFSFRIINECKQFMLKNKEVDIMGFDGYGCSSSKKLSFHKSKYIEGYQLWLENKKPFIFCGLSFMIRKMSLSYMGLFNTKFKMLDLEYSLRISSSKTTIAYHTGLGFVAIANPDSNSVKFNTLIEKERQKIHQMYLPELDRISLKYTKATTIHFLSKIKNGILLPSKQLQTINYSEIVSESIKLLEKDSAEYEILNYK